MSSKKLGVIGFLILINCTQIYAQVPNSAQIKEEHHDLSVPISRQPMLDANALADRAANRIMPVRRVTPHMRGKHEDRATNRESASSVASPVPTSALVATANVATGGTLINIEGIGENAGAPSDANGSAGLSQYVQWTNLQFAVYDKGTGLIAAGFPKNGNAIFADFTGSAGADACRLSNNGDPLAQYDKLADRWVLSQFAWLPQNQNTGPYYQCVAVSTSSDATGAYNRYVFESRTAGNAIAFNDYGKVGVWPDAYYFTYVLFTPLASGIYLGPQVCAYERAAMLSGSAAVGRCRDFGTSFGPLLPSDVDGRTAPPAGSPNFLLGFDFNGAGVGNILQMWKFSFTADTLSARVDIPVAAFTIACPSTFGGPCVRQPAPGELLDSLGDRPMYRLAYRNFGTYENLVVSHTVQQPGALANGPVGIRWYELRNPNAAVSVYQQGTYAPDATSRWMGSAAMDKKGNIALGYSASSTAVFPGVRYTGRLRSEPRGFLESEATIIDGSGSQISTFNRWGDYSSMSIDPVDDCTFWYTQQYMGATGSFNWRTRIASFKFANCN